MYENHEYDGGGKNDWHYVEIIRKGPSSVTWRNRAGAQWDLALSDDKTQLVPTTEGSGYPCEVKYDQHGRVTKLVQQGEGYDRVDMAPIASAPADNISPLVGMYENHEYDGGGKNDWHYVEIIRKGPSSVTWRNRAGAQWDLALSDDKTQLVPTTEGSGYPCEVKYDQHGRVTKLVQQGEAYDRVDMAPIGSGAMDSTLATEEAISLLSAAAFSEGKPIDVDRLSQLLAAGANPNGTDSSGRPLVMIVTDNVGAGESATGALLALKAAGADLDAPNKDGVSAMLMAAKNMNEDACWALVRAQLGDDELASGIGWPGLAEAGILSCNKAGEALVMAAGKGDLEVMRTMLNEHKADPNYRRTVEGSPSALHLAAQKLPADRFAQVVDMIIEAGGDVDVVNIHGCTPMHYALESVYHPSERRDDVVAILLERGANPGKLTHAEIVLPLGSKGGIADIHDWGGTPLMYGMRGRNDSGLPHFVAGYDPMTDVSFRSLFARMVPWAEIEEAVVAMTGQTGAALTERARNLISLGFGEELKIFIGKDRAGHKIAAPWDKLQMRNQLYLAGYTDQTELHRRARLISEVVLIPLIEMLSLPEVRKEDRKISKDLCVYLLDQGVGFVCLPELRAVAQKANAACEAMYNQHYEALMQLQELTAEPSITYAGIRHPYEHLEWLRPGQENTVIAAIELMRGHAVRSMTELCEFVSSCQGSYHETYYSPWVVVPNFWVSVHARLIIGQAESCIDDHLQEALLRALPEHLHKAMQRAPVKTLARVQVKQVEYSTLGQQIDTLNAKRRDDAFETDEERARRKEELAKIHVAFREQAWKSSFVDRTAASGVIDIARRAIVLDTEEDFIEVYRECKKSFHVVREKNGFHPNFDTKGSGYRDCKLNLSIEYEDGEWLVSQIVEIQIILGSFLDVKKLSHVPYTILRGDFG